MEAQRSTGRATGGGEFSQQQPLDPQQSSRINMDSDNRPSVIQTNVIQFQFDHQGSENHAANGGHGELPVPVSLEAPPVQTSESVPSTSMLPSRSNGSRTRKQRQLVPAHKKDDAYWQKRSKNNASVRKCRAAARSKSNMEFQARLNRAIRMVHKIRRLILQLEDVMKNLMEMKMAFELDGFHVSSASDSDSNSNPETETETETGSQ